LRGFTIFEAVITILILSVASASVAILVDASNKNSELYQTDEMLTKIKVIANDIFSRYWDESAFTADTQGKGYKICDTQSQTSYFGRNGALRVGDFNRGESSRQFYQTTTSASQMPSYLKELSTIIANSINDYNGVHLSQNGVDYSVSVSYVPDSVTFNGNSGYTEWSNQASSTTTTNLKKITISAKNIQNEAVEVNFYRSNIGSIIQSGK
jgi:Tfp pilus assembly protein PilV